MINAPSFEHRDDLRLHTLGSARDDAHDAVGRFFLSFEGRDAIVQK